MRRPIAPSWMPAARTSDRRQARSPAPEPRLSKRPRARRGTRTFSREPPTRQRTITATISPASMQPAAQRMGAKPEGRGATVVAAATTAKVTTPSSTLKAPMLPAIRIPPPSAAG